jgi:hypothetical protein
MHILRPPAPPKEDFAAAGGLEGNFAAAGGLEGISARPPGRRPVRPPGRPAAGRQAAAWPGGRHVPPGSAAAWPQISGQPAAAARPPGL